MIHVFGHQNPDTDAITAALVYADLLRRQGHEASAYRLGELNFETAYVLREVEVEAPPLLTELPAGSEVALVDHNESGQSLPGLSGLTVTRVVDHHKLGDLTTSQPPYLRFEPLGCTATILTKLHREAHLTPDATTARLLLSAVLSDTLHFRSPTTTPEDREVVAYLAPIAGIADVAGYARAMFDAKSDLGDTPAERLLKMDYKVFPFGSRKWGIGVIETTNPGYVFGRQAELLAALRAEKAAGGLDGIILGVVDILNETNRVLVPGEAEAAVMQGAFGATVTDGVADLGDHISRKKQVVPGLERYFADQGVSDPSPLDWLYARQRFGMHPGLDRVRALLEWLGEPQEAFTTLLVGGTNGKGSTAASLAAMLGASGRRTALFTSPHLTRFAERFVVDGRELPGPQVLAALEDVRPHAEALGASFFEVVTALACVLFAEAGAEWAVMEVGLGGRLDATNALDPALSVVTSIGLDHTEILGNTVEAIAAEKAGILRAGRPAVTGASGSALAVLEAAGADLWALGREAILEAEPLGWDGWALDVRSPAGELSFETPLLGRHGANNAALAALAAQRLGVPTDAIAAGAAAVRWPGRLERLPWRGGWVLLDGAHNPDGARALRETVQALGLGRVPLIFGTSGDKDVAGLAAELAPIAGEVIVTRALLSPRAADPAALARLWSVPVQVAETPQAALDLLPPGGRAVACGSLYLVGELRPLLLGEADEGRERWQ